MTTFRHNTVGDYFFPGLVKDGKGDTGYGIVELRRLRELRIKELGLSF